MISEQWLLTLQLLHKDFKKVLIGQVSSINNLACTWRVRMKEKESIKGEGGNERWGSENREKNTVVI